MSKIEGVGRNDAERVFIAYRTDGVEMRVPYDEFDASLPESMQWLRGHYHASDCVPWVIALAEAQA